jgi:hypothetical protein
MSDRIKLVRGDTGPQIRLNLTDTETGDPTDLTGATVTLHFREPGADTVLFSRPAFINPDEAATGVCYVVWEEGDLDVEEGNYEGEVEVINATGVRETVYVILKFKVRKDFA